MSVRTLVASLAVAACTQRAPVDRPAAGGAERSVVIVSSDSTADVSMRRCLANSSGVVVRSTDTEAFAAVDPQRPDRVLAIWQTGSGNGSVVQWARSIDGGKRWSAPRAAPINACAGGPVPNATRASDPWVSFGPDGRAYLSAIAWQPSPSNGPDLVSALVVVASADGGLTWNAPVAAAVAPSTDIGHDNLAITADPTRPRTVYAATTRELRQGTSYFGRLGFTRSDDGGKTWIPIRAITPAINQERIGAPQIVVDPRSRRLYAVYRRSRGGEASIGVMMSDDRGDTWSTESVVATHVRGAQVRHPVTGNPFVLAADIVQATVSPTTGDLVIVYADARRSPGGRHEISLVWSRDAIRWSAPLTISDDSLATSWLPAVSATARGEIGVSHFSSRFLRSDSTARVMLRRFSVDAEGLKPLGTSMLDEFALEWPGDYHALVAAGDRFVAAYGRVNDIAVVRR